MMDAEFDFLQEQQNLSDTLKDQILSMQSHFMKQIRLNVMDLVNTMKHNSLASTVSCKEEDLKIIKKIIELFDNISTLHELKHVCHQSLTYIEMEHHDPICRKNWQDFISYQQHNLKLINQIISSFEVSSSIQPTIENIDNLDTERAYQMIIDPLSNSKRLDILYAIKKGDKRFKNLEATLGLQAGHLLYHLNPLKETNYVIQDGQKNYHLTEKGDRMLSYLLALFNDFEIENK